MIHLCWRHCFVKAPGSLQGLGEGWFGAADLGRLHPAGHVTGGGVGTKPDPGCLQQLRCLQARPLSAPEEEVAGASQRQTPKSGSVQTQTPATWCWLLSLDYVRCIVLLISCNISSQGGAGRKVPHRAAARDRWMPLTVKPRGLACVDYEQLHTQGLLAWSPNGSAL